MSSIYPNSWFIICTNCGSAILAGGIKCKDCGATLKQSTSIKSKQKSLQEFKQFTLHMNKDLLLHTFYWHLPLKNFIRTQVIRYQDKQLFPVKRSIPRFTDEDWFKIVSTEN